MPKTNKAAFIIYDESTDLGDFVDWLNVNHFRAVISPLHDKDMWTPRDVRAWAKSQARQHDCPEPDLTEDTWTWYDFTDVHRVDLQTAGALGPRVGAAVVVRVPKPGDLKKPHRHILMKFDYSMTFETLRDKLSEVGVAYFENVESETGYLRYLCHLDSPDKHQYSVNDVMAVGGYDVSPLYVKSCAAKAAVEQAVMVLVRDKHIVTFSALVDAAFDESDYDLWCEVKGSSHFWVAYLKDRRYLAFHPSEVSHKTGPVLRHGPVENGE